MAHGGLAGFGDVEETVATYFGLTAEYASFYGNSTAQLNKNLTFTCPGTGAQNLISLGMYGKSGGSTAGNSRVAIYLASDRSFIAQGSAEILVDSTTAAWIDHTSFTNIGESPISPQLVGGTNYIICLSRDSNDVKTGYEFGSADDMAAISGSDYTGGFPTPIGEGAGSTVKYNIRAGVEAAAGGAASPTSVLGGPLVGPMGGPI